MRNLIVADQLLELNQAAERLVQDAVHSELVRCEKICGYEIPIFLHYMPNGDVLQEDIYRERIGRSRIVLSLALRDQEEAWVPVSVRNFSA